MKKIIIGKKRRQILHQKQKNMMFGDILFIGGILIMCTMLVFPMAENAEKVKKNNGYISVMSGGVQAREELVRPEKPASGKEWSVFDAIGELFAELIFDRE
ncbi:MAG: hypothetical protein ACI4XJ_05830 [Eubacteriales bacterium]